MKKWEILITLGLLLAIVTLSCSSLSSSKNQSVDLTKLGQKELPNTPGFFYIDNKEMIEIAVNNGNNKIDFPNSLRLSSHNPEFIYFGKNTEIDDLNLYDHTGKPISIEQLELKTNAEHPEYQLIQIKISAEIPDGFYCFSFEEFINPVIVSSLFDSYCFSVLSGDQLGQVTPEQRFNLPAEQMGFFLVDNDEIYYLPEMELKDPIDLSILPVSNQLFPTILFQSDSKSPDGYTYIWYPPSIGVSLSGNRISGISSDLGAAQAGILRDDKIVAINGVEVTNWGDSAIFGKFFQDCEYGAQIDLQVLRGTQRFSASPICTFNESAGYGTYYFNYTLHPDGYAIFTNKYPLYSGHVYCFMKLISMEYIRHCFRIE